MAKITRTNQRWLTNHFKKLGVSAERPKVIVHSKLVAFGKIEGGLNTFHSALLKTLGSNATIAVPTYTVSLTRDQPYNPKATKPDSMGAYSNFILSRPDRTRSLCPIHNHAAIGKRAKLLEHFSDGSFSLGPGSDFEWFFNEEFDLLLLGCNFSEGATYLHHLEAIAEVPYRKWVDTERRIVGPDGAITTKKIRYFSRVRHDLTENFSSLETDLIAAGKVVCSKAPYGQSFRIPIRLLHKLASEALERNPYFLVSPKFASE